MRDGEAIYRARGFVAVVPWEQIRSLMTPAEWNAFQEWVYGQTTLPEGVYPWDLKAFLSGLPVTD